MRRWQKALALCALLALIAGLTWLDYSANRLLQIPDQPQANSEQDYPSKNNDPTFSVSDIFREVRSWHSEVWIAMGTMALVIATGVLGFIAWRQIVTTRQQMRAYLTITGAQIGASSLGAPQRELVFFRNTGQTPAYRVEVWLVERGDVYPPNGSFERPLGMEAVSQGTIGPGADFHLTQPMRTLSPTEIAGLRNGNLALFLYGAVDYVDAFGTSRVTPFRFFIGGPIGLPASGNLSPYREGNDAT